MPVPTDAKVALRREMRALRRALPDRAERSTRIWTRVAALPAFRSARTVVLFASVVGEPETADFIARCRSEGRTVLLPEDDPPPDPALADVVIVPGLAFTRRGDRLGQGGGWYDRFLASTRSGCATIGVGFAAQVVDRLPVEPHDVRLDVVVTDESTYGEVGGTGGGTAGADPLPSRTPSENRSQTSS